MYSEVVQGSFQYLATRPGTPARTLNTIVHPKVKLGKRIVERLMKLENNRNYLIFLRAQLHDEMLL